jgi:hypothetical protein
MKVSDFPFGGGGDIRAAAAAMQLRLVVVSFPSGFDFALGECGGSARTVMQARLVNPNLA